MPPTGQYQSIPLSSATGVLNTTTVDVAIPSRCSQIGVWMSADGYFAISDDAAINLSTSNAALGKANQTYLLPVRPGYSGYVHVESRADTGTYEISFYR